MNFNYSNTIILMIKSRIQGFIDTKTEDSMVKNTFY
jgi:hypothetical protein